MLQHFCERHGSHLVHVDNSTENNFLKAHVKFIAGIIYNISPGKD